ncbi:MAG: response regulator [Pirellulaceae bacterium]
MNPQPHAYPLTDPLRVLVAEDGLVNRHLAQRLLQREGCEVTIAANGELAVHELDSQQFDLVLMDIDMPVMDGLTATRTIREKERETGTYTPIVALTSNTNREQCFAAGMDAFLSKPLHLSALRKVLGDVLDGNAA